MREIGVKKRENWEKNKWLKIRDWVGEIIIYKGDGEIHFCQKNKRKKDTYVFRKIQRTLLSRQKKLLFLK